MQYQENTIYHIYNHSNDGGPIFFQERNYVFFIRKTRVHLLPYVDFLAYCLMPTHFHFLVYTKPAACTLLPPKTDKDFEQQRLHRAIGNMLSSYTRAINNQEERRGSLFRGKTKAKNGILEGGISLNNPREDGLFKQDNDYALRCFHYIHNNPVKDELVVRATDWAYSSAKDYAGLRNGTLCNQALAKKLLFE